MATGIEWKNLLTRYDEQLLVSEEIGNLANDGTWSYSWQHGRQLKQMSRPDASGDTEMIRFRYDSNGHRIGKDSGIYHISYSGGEIVYAGETTRTSYSLLGDTLTQVNISASILTYSENCSPTTSPPYRSHRAKLCTYHAGSATNLVAEPA